MKTVLLQRLHEMLRPLATHRCCPYVLDYTWCRLGDAAYGGPLP